MRLATLAVALALALPCTSLAAEIDPTAHGRYPVGFTRITFTKSSVTTGEPRPLDTWIWYPSAQASAGGAPFIDADVRRGRWPLLLFSHGSCSFPGQSVFLTETLASWGVIVAAPSHPGSSIFDPAACLTSGNDSFANRPPDMQFVLTALLQLDSERGSQFRGRIRHQRIGVSGHSFGGQTALRVAAVDPRIRATLALAPARQSGLTIPNPLMVIGGALDSLTPFATHAIPSYDEGTGRKFIVRIDDTGHCAFAPICIASLCGDGCPPIGIDQPTANHLVLRYAVPFVLRYVAGKPRYGSLLNPATAPAGVVVVTNTLRP